MRESLPVPVSGSSGRPRPNVWTRGCLTAFLGLSLGACATVSPKLHIDPSLTAPCARPVLSGPTYRNLATLAVRQNAALRECSGRMAALRKLGR